MGTSVVAATAAVTNIAAVSPSTSTSETDERTTRKRNLRNKPKYVFYGDDDDDKDDDDEYRPSAKSRRRNQQQQMMQTQKDQDMSGNLNLVGNFAASTWIGNFEIEFKLTQYIEIFKFILNLYFLFVYIIYELI